MLSWRNWCVSRAMKLCSLVSHWVATTGFFELWMNFYKTKIFVNINVYCFYSFPSSDRIFPITLFGVWFHLPQTTKHIHISRNREFELSHWWYLGSRFYESLLGYMDPVRISSKVDVTFQIIWNRWIVADTWTPFGTSHLDVL